ncbi:hypothetical protein CDL15_Pgr002238 [Punica granatum]|nr:hypothetical protein CDL15_Pgr002238 [Punica granatum]PKI54190.1 hypothetical protein CRG98_025423 [Punica granatum]
MPSPKSSSLISTEIKNPMRTLVLSCACRIVRVLSRAKSFLVKAVQRKLDKFQIHFMLPAKKSKNKKIYLGSFRFHYNWCSASSSHVQPFPAPFSTSHLYYYDPTWDSMISMEPADQDNNSSGDSQLSKYLEWLEEKDNAHAGEESSDNGTSAHEECADEIDKLADIFIAKCHQKFILEKQESDRRFQEMIAI